METQQSQEQAQTTKPSQLDIMTAQTTIRDNFPRIPRHDLEPFADFLARKRVPPGELPTGVLVGWIAYAHTRYNERMHPSPRTRRDCDTRWRLQGFSGANVTGREAAVLETVKPIIRAVLTSWQAEGKYDDQFWQQRALADDPTSAPPAACLAMTHDLFPRLGEEAITAAKYYQERDPPTRFSAERAVVLYARDSHTDYGMIEQQYWDQPRDVRDELGRHGMGHNKYILGHVGAFWEMCLRKSLPKDVGVQALDEFQQRHPFFGVVFDGKDLEMLAGVQSELYLAMKRERNDSRVEGSSS